VTRFATVGFNTSFGGRRVVEKGTSIVRVFLPIAWLILYSFIDIRPVWSFPEATAYGHFSFYSALIESSSPKLAAGERDKVL
jgi:hypothetical protein